MDVPPGLSIQILLDPSSPSCTLYFASEPSTSTASFIRASDTFSSLLLERLASTIFLGNEDVRSGSFVSLMPVVVFPGFVALSTFIIASSSLSSTVVVFELFGDAQPELLSSSDILSESKA